MGKYSAKELHCMDDHQISTGSELLSVFLEGYRMTYLLSTCAVHGGIRVDVVEVLSHAEYDSRFGY